MATLAMGVRWGGEACAAAQPAVGRREQAVPPALVSAAGAGIAQIEEALRPLDGYRTVTGARIVHILTKLTKPSVPVNLVGPQVSLPPR